MARKMTLSLVVGEPYSIPAKVFKTTTTIATYF
jgi:hypothetical protein